MEARLWRASHLREKRAPLPFFVRLREGDSPWPWRGAMVALHLRLGAPFTIMVAAGFGLEWALFCRDKQFCVATEFSHE